MSCACPAMLWQDCQVIAAKSSLHNAQDSRSDHKLRRNQVEKRTAKLGIASVLIKYSEVLLVHFLFHSVFAGPVPWDVRGISQEISAGQDSSEDKALGVFDWTGAVYMHPAHSGVDISTTDQALDRRKLLPWQRIV